MTLDESDRIIEILFYYYFMDKINKVSTTNFWEMIKKLCDTYTIDATAIAKAVRIVAVPENTPNEEEAVYLLIKQLGMSSRPFNKLTGIYWQKQLKYKNQFEDASKCPTIKRRITDIAMKKNMRDFIFAVYDFLGVFTNIDILLLNKV